MRVPLSWLREYVEITLPLPELAERLTLAGLAVDAIERVGDWWDPNFIRVAEVVAVRPHPDADRLTLVDVDDGSGALEQVVTGAPNIFAFKGCTKAEGTLPVLKAPFARVGAELLDAYTEVRPRPFKKLKPSKIRGVLSNGMICSERELGLSEEHEGILLLPADAPVGTPLRDYLGDAILELDLTPDLARALSIVGVAREVAALTGGALHLPAHLAAAGNAPQSVPLAPAALAAVDGLGAAVIIRDPQLCSRYTGMLIADVQVGPSPTWMRDRLTRAGMRSISNVVDITNYVMLALGQPLHAFDYDVLVERAHRVGESTPTIIVQRAQPGEKFTTLDNVERTLTDEMLMIADRAGSVAIAGVMGGLESEVSDGTRNILLESATFDAGGTRRTAQALKLHSEASYRFIRGVPATLNALAARYAADLLVEFAGGRIVSGPEGVIIDAYPAPQVARTVYTTATDMQRLLGMPVRLDEVAAALERLDFAVEQVTSPAPDAPPAATCALARTPDEPLLACTAPWYRLDIAVPADLTEEVARVIGYELVGMTLLADELPPQRRNETHETEERIRNILTAAGLQETVNYALTSPESHARLQPGRAGNEPFIALANPIAPERRTLRRALMTSALENYARNARLAPRHATFEVGRVYLPEAGDGVLPFEDRRLSLLLAGPRTPADFHTPESDAELDFQDLKGVVELLLERLGFLAAQVEFQAAPETPPFGPRCAALLLNGTLLGHLGEVHPRVRQAFDLPPLRVAAAELRIDPLVRPHFQLTPMRPISPYPPVTEDLAFEVGEEVTARRLEQSIRSAGGFLLTEVELFDIFRGGTLAAGRKSVAFHLTYQSPERPLTEREVASLRRRVIDAVVKECGATLRG